MGIDFSRLSKPFTAVVPVFSNAFLLKRKQYRLTAPDGWYVVEIVGNNAKVVEPYFWVTPPKDIVRGVTHNNLLVFSNFDVAKRNWSLHMQAELQFNTAETFTSVLATVWEDGRVYSVSPNYEDLFTSDVKDAFRDELSLGSVKGMTPELRYTYLVHSIEREQIRARLQELEKVRREEEFRQSFEGRLKLTFERAGANMVSYSRSGNHIIVDWRLDSYNFNSVLNATTFTVVEAGYCMSGDDRRHNITSLVKTAKDYEENAFINITRR